MPFYATILSEEADVTVRPFPEMPVTTSLIPYTKRAIPIRTPASSIPNAGNAIIAIDRAIASDPTPTLNALEPLLATYWFFLFFALRPEIILAMPASSSAIAASHITSAAVARGNNIIMIESIMTNPPSPI
jgi:hypothetical protein